MKTYVEGRGTCKLILMVVYCTCVHVNMCVWWGVGIQKRE